MVTDLFRVASRNLFRYPVKTLAVVVPLALATGLFSTMVFVQRGLQKDAEGTTKILPDVTVQKTVGGRVERIGVDRKERIEGIEGVAKVVPRVWGYVPIERGRDVLTYTLMGIDLASTEIPALIGITLESGRFLERGGSDEAVVGQAFASVAGVAAGDRVSIKDTFGNEEEFLVVGIFSSDIAIYSSDLILTTIDKARSFFNYEAGEATDLSVYTSDPSRADAVAASLAHGSPGLRVFTREKLADLLVQSFSDRGGVFQVLWLVLLLACLIVSMNQGVSVGVDHRMEIGILKALGWSRADIIGLKMLESLIMGLAGTTLGMILGLAYLRAGAPAVKEYFIGWAKIYPDFAIPLAVDPSTIILLFLIGTVPLVTASVLPAWLIGITETDRVLRR